MTKTATMPEIDFAVVTEEPQPNAVPVVMQQAAPPAVQPTTMLDIIDRASRDPNVDIDKLERLIGMKERMEAEQNRREFDNAMASAQSEMDPIRADLENKQTKSRYASYAHLDTAVRPIYSTHGFALTFNTGDAPNPSEVRVLCTVSHRAGHRQDYKIDMPADGKGPQGAAVMTRTHATGAAASYGQRYLLKLIFNLAVGDVDDDGNGAGGGLDSDIEANAPPGAPRDENGKLLSAYNVNKLNKAKDYADSAIQTLNLSPNKEAAKEWWRGAWTAPPGKRTAPLGWLQVHAPEQFQRVQTAYENVVGLE